MKNELMKMLQEVVTTFKNNYNFTRGLNEDPIEKATVTSFKDKTFIPVHGNMEKIVDIWVIDIQFNGVSIAKSVKVIGDESLDAVETAALKDMYFKLLTNGLVFCFKHSSIAKVMTPSVN